MAVTTAMAASDERILYPSLQIFSLTAASKLLLRSCTAAEVSGDLKQSLRSGFEVLANYIFGNNAKRESISMTSPVTLESRKESEKIAMTVPVTQ